MLIGTVLLTAAATIGYGYVRFRRWQTEGRQMYLSFCDALCGGERR